MQNIETKGHSLVIAIDFGTTYSAYAYAHVEEKLDIRVMNYGKNIKPFCGPSIVHVRCLFLIFFCGIECIRGISTP